MMYVRLKGELPPIFLPAGPSTSVGEALQIAAQMWRKEADRCKLYFNGKVLDDPSKSLGDYGVGPDDMVELVCEEKAS